MRRLARKQCTPRGRGEKPLPPDRVRELAREVPGWELNDAQTHLFREEQFRDFHETMAFANAVAWVAHCQDHHPEMEVGFSWCLVRFSTGAVDGLTENDFICAARINLLLDAGKT